MTRFAHPLAILVLAATAFNASAGSAEDLRGGAAIEESLTKKKHLRAAQSAFEVERAFGFAAKERGRQAIEISCAPADSDWCANDFVAACDKNDGGMSTNPDGGVTCSLPQHE
jgi:hypothetical protein